jgi:2-methylcitrate dehydratase PrpD
MTLLPEDALVAQLVSRQDGPVAPATRARLAQALLDWFTAGWSGAAMSGAAQMRAVAAASFPCAGPAPVFGGAAATPLAAAFSNAAIAHLREIDDAHRAAMLHPGVVAVTPVLALAASQAIPQRRAIDAMVAGYEVALRLGEALGTRHAALFHATATAGAVGAAAASAVALGLPAAQVHHAMGHAATQAAGLWQLVDDEAHASKSLHPAFAVRNGMMAAWSAQAGLPGARAFFTGKRGLYALLAGEGPLEAVTSFGAGGIDRINTVTVKAWPSCAQIFTPLDALRGLMDAHRFEAAEVASLDVTIFPHALKIAGVDWPANAAQTPFCLRYVLAALLRHGRLGIQEMEQPELQDAALLALAARIRVHTDDAFQKAFPERRPARIDIVLQDGRRLSQQRDLRRGDPEDPFDWSQLVARMRAFAPHMDDAAAGRITAWCAGFADESADGRACLPPPVLFAA